MAQADLDSRSFSSALIESRLRLPAILTLIGLLCTLDVASCAPVLTLFENLCWEIVDGSRKFEAAHRRRAHRQFSLRRDRRAQRRGGALPALPCLSHDA